MRVFFCFFFKLAEKAKRRRVRTKRHESMVIEGFLLERPKPEQVVAKNILEATPDIVRVFVSVLHRICCFELSFCWLCFFAVFHTLFLFYSRELGCRDSTSNEKTEA